MISIASDRVAIHDLSSIGVNHPRIRPPMNGGDNFTESRVPDPDESSGGSIVRRVGTDWMNGFKVGDMVWGKVKSHPWWPGHIFNESFASPPVRRSRREGHVLVAFFGDSSYGWFDPAELIPFEPNFPEKSHQTTSRNFVKAVEEAVDEFNRRAALGLTCRCRNPNNFRPTGVTGYFAVDVPGFEPGGIYSDLQINKSRDMFLPSEMVSFVRKLAASPRETENHQSCDWLQSMEMMTAYRRAVFEEFDETYAQAFGVQPVRKLRQDDAGAGEQRERISSRGIKQKMSLSCCCLIIKMIGCILTLLFHLLVIFGARTSLVRTLPCFILGLHCCWGLTIIVLTLDFFMINTSYDLSP